MNKLHNKEINQLDVSENLKQIIVALLLLLLLLLTYQPYTSVTDRQQTHVGMLTSTLRQTSRRHNIVVATVRCYRKLLLTKKTVITSESAVAAAVYSVRASSGPGTGACALPQLCTVL